MKHAQFLGHMFGVATPGGYTMTYNILNVLVTPSYDQSALLGAARKEAAGSLKNIGHKTLKMRRNELQAKLKEKGIHTAAQYPIPLNLRL